MVVRTAGHQIIARRLQAVCQSGGVFEHLLLVAVKLRTQSFAESHGLGRDNMHERTALNAGKNLAVQALGHIFALFLIGQDHAAARAAQGLVRSGGGNVGVGNGRRMQTGGHKSGDMGHIDNELGPHFVGRLAESSEIDDTRIGAGSGHNHGGFMLPGHFFHLLVIDAPRFALHTVKNHLKQASRKIDRAAVRKVSAVGKIHTQNGIAGLQVGKVGGHIGLAARMRLHVGIGAIKQLHGSVASQIFRNIHKFATAVIALARVSFGIFVGEHRSLRILKHQFLHDVLLIGKDKKADGPPWTRRVQAS